jgi:hypothetical protein
MFAHGAYPLQQIVKRVYETETNFIRKETDAAPYSLHKEHREGPLTHHCANGTQFKYLRFGKNKNIFLSTKKPNNTVMLKEDEDIVVAVIENYVRMGNNVFLIGRRFNSKSDIYISPVPSSSLYIYKVTALNERLECCPFDKVRCKVFNMVIPGISSRAIFPIPVDLV